MIPVKKCAPISFAVALAMAVIPLVIPTTAQAASASWTGATDSNWATSTNWSASPVPGTGETATFSGTGNGNRIISLGTGVTIKTLSFDTASASYTIGAGAAGSETLTLNHGGLIAIGGTITQSDHLINAAIVLGTNANTGTYQVFTDANRTLTFAGPVRGGTGSTAGTKMLSIGLNGDSGNVIFNGIIGGGSGTIAVTKTGTLTLTLSGNNTFTGALTIIGGNITVPVVNNSNADGPLGRSTGAVEFDVENAFGGGILKYTGATASSSKRFTLTSSGTFEIESAETNLTLTGVIGGGGGLGKRGPGTLTLAAVNTYNGTLIRQGTLKLSGSGSLGATTGSLTFTSGGKLDLGGTDQTVGEMLSYDGVGTIVNNGGGASVLTFSSGGIAGWIFDNDNATAGTVALTKVGTGAAGMALLPGSNYSGAVLVTNGIFGVNTPDSLGSATTGTTVSSGATLEIQSTTIAAEPVRISGVGETGYAGALTGGNATYGGLLTLNAASTIGTSSFAAGPFDITNPGTITGATFTLTLAGEGIGSIASIIGTTSGGVTKTGTGKWTLTGANTYTGTTTISAGILNIQNANALGASTSNDTTITAGATLQIEGGITTPAAEGVTVRGVGAAGATGAFQNVAGINKWTGPVILGADSTISSDAGLFNISSTGTITGSTFDLTLAGAGNGTIASVIGTTSGTLIKAGSGKWTLTGLSTYAGKSFIRDGTLEINTLKNTGAGNTSSLGTPTTAVNGTIDIGSTTTTGTLQFIGTADAASNRVINLAGTTGGAALDSSSATNHRLLLTSAFTATGLGDKTLTLTGTSSGDNEISAAIVNSTGFKTSVTKTGGGNWKLSGASTYTGDTSVNAGTLTITNAFLANAADVNLLTGATLNLTFAGSDTIDQLRIDGVVQSAGAWGSPTSSATYKTALISGSGILNVSTGAALQPYATWIATHGLTGAATAFDADPDHDSLANGLEWILGGNPLVLSLNVLPQLTSNATDLFLTFSRSDASESTSTLVFEWSTQLPEWTSAAIGATSSGPDADGVTINVTENGTSPDTVVITIPKSNAPDGRLFLRLKATMP